MRVGYDSAFRSFSYRDPVTRNLRPYDVALRPGVALSAELYPLANAGVSVLGDVGFVGGFAQTFGFDSNIPSSGTVTTSFQRFDVGVRGRIHTGDPVSSPLIGLTVAYESSSFTFGAPTSVAASELPSVTYRFVRTGVDVRVPLGDFALFGAASYEAVLAAETMDSHFPREVVRGVAFAAGGSRRVLPWLEARIEAAYDRRFYDLRPQPGDVYAAGGALDEYLSVQLGVAAIF